MPRSDQPSLDLVIYALLLAVLGMGITGMFIKAQNVEQVRDVTSCLTLALTGAVSAKFGLSRSAAAPSVEHPPPNEVLDKDKKL